jgi:glycine/D-amino acid oxidase-like deaminating enzyme
MSLKETPVWLEGVTFPETDPAQPLPERVDAAVIGGGFTGLAAARALARAGASVAALEARGFGWGASSRNGGMVLTGLKVEADQLIARYGRDMARRMFAASLASIDCVEQIVREERIDCDFVRGGHLLLAYKPAHFRAFVHEAALLKREFGHVTRIVPPGELGAEIGSRAYHGGLVDEASAGVNPARYVGGLARAAQRAGAQLFDRTPVERISREKVGANQTGPHKGRPDKSYPYVVHTPRGALRAGAVFVATGGYTGPATPALRRRIIPIGSYIIATAPLPEDLAHEVSPHGRMMFDSKNFLYYFRLTPDRRMLFGGRAGFFPETPATVRQSAEILRRGMIAVYPQLRDAPVEHAWGGTLDFAFDMMPHAGTLDGLHYALGYAGHGVAMATYLGTQVAARIAGAPADNPFADIAFPTAPLGLYDGRPWFLPLAGVWYKFLDWIR